MKPRLEIILFFSIIIMLFSMWWAIHDLTNEIEERGVKSILSEVWNGPVKYDNPH